MFMLQKHINSLINLVDLQCAMKSFVSKFDFTFVISELKNTWVVFFWKIGHFLYSISLSYIGSTIFEFYNLTSDS